MFELRKLFSKRKIADAPQPSGQPRQSVDSEITDCSEPDFIDNRPAPLAVLKQFVPIRNLDDASIQLLSHTIKSYSAGSTIYVRGQPSDSVYYLLEGALELSPDSASKYQISAQSPHSHLPLNSSKRFGASALALTDVKIIDVSADLIQFWTLQSIEESNTIDLIDLELPEQLLNNRFFLNFAQIYQENKLSLPSLPAVAFKLKQAMTEDIDIAEATRIIQIDPSITTKLIQITNSPLYSPATPINNCHEAVTRLGLKATRNLVMGISLKQMFRCDNKKLLKAMQALWRNSLYLSSLGFVLADESGVINPEDALLAGLISDIGVIPLLHFAEQYPDQYTDLEQAMPYLRGPVGTLVLHTLGFSEQLAQIPHHAEDWYFNSGDELSLIDIVILSKLHSYIGQPQGKERPYIHSVPAYSKLKNGKLDPDFSLSVLQKAQQQIKAAMQILL